MKPLITAFLLFSAYTVIAQQQKVVTMPEFIYTHNDPDKYKWKKVCTLHERTIFQNTIACTDSIIYSFGGFSDQTIRVSHEINAIIKGRFSKLDLQYPGQGFMCNIFFARDSFLYIGGGLDSNKATYNWLDFWQYNTYTKAWKRLKDLPFYYHSCQQIFQNKDQIIAIIPQLSGANFEVTTVCFYQYNVPADQWILQQSANPTPEIRAPAAFKIGDDAFVLSQPIKQDSSQLGNALYKFNLTTRLWSVLPSFPGGHRTLAFACNDDRYGYFGGGVAGLGMNMPETFYRFDPVPEKWERYTDLPRGMRWSSGWWFQNELYVGFGINDKYDNTVPIWKLRQKQ